MDGTRLLLRPATLEDAALLRRWRNDPVVRAQSFTTHAVTAAEHARWLEQRLDDHERCRIYVAEDGGEPAGQARVDRKPDGTGEISVSLARGSRGRGLGHVLIRSATERGARELDLDEVIARIKPANESSLRAFARAGFTATGEAGQEVVLRWRRPADREPAEHAR